MTTPGLRFIVFQSPKLVAPFLVAYLARYALAYFSHIDVSYRVCLSAVLGCLLLTAILKSSWDGVSERRAMLDLGAVRIPEWKGKWPGNIDLALLVLKRFKFGYPGLLFTFLLRKVVHSNLWRIGEGFEESMNQFGSIVQLQLLGKRLIVTAEPEHIKVRCLCPVGSLWLIGFFKTLLSTEFKNFEKGIIIPKSVLCFQSSFIIGSEFFEVAKSVLGTGVFNADGEASSMRVCLVVTCVSCQVICGSEQFDLIA